MTPALPGIMSVIKNETSAWHARVEALVPVFGEGFSMADYRRLLERFHGFYAGLEPEMKRAEFLDRALPDWRTRSKLPSLEEDLAWHGYTREQISSLPVCAALPQFPTVAEALGVLYVTEGSTLGGQIICRQLAKCLHVEPGKGASFFSGYGADTGSRWRVFTSNLTAFACPENERVIVEAAVATFRKMAEWLSRENRFD